MIRIASYNVENLFARPKAFNPLDWTFGRAALDAYHEVNTLFAKAGYSAADKQMIRNLLLDLDIYRRNQHGAIRRKFSRDPQWAWLRKNRGKFDREPRDATQNVQIIANGRDDWIGWVELAKQPTNETSVRMTARVIRDVNADIIGIVEAEDRPSLVRFNNEMLGGQYGHVMLIDGNDGRGIDVGIMTAENIAIESIKSNVDTVDNVGTIFSRDCPQYKVRTPGGTEVHILVNHFKSQSGGGGIKRQRQAAEVRRIVNGLVGQGEHVVVLGDLNEGPPGQGSQAPNLFSLFNNNSPLIDCYSLANFQDGGRPGTYDSCGWHNRLDYIFISEGLQPYCTGGGIFRQGLWGTRMTRPTQWQTYAQMTHSTDQASDHAAVYIDLNI
jgi:endonuclease/exonuclease/phosphatase family metal-dependent hydrolase